MAHIGEIILDTQEIVGLIREGKSPPYGSDIFITSTTAQELFRLRIKGSGKPAYWIPALQKVNQAPLKNRRDWRVLVKEYAQWGPAYRDRHHDRLVIDFGRDYPAIAETGHKSIAKIINERKGWLFPMCAEASGLKFSREMRARVEYIEDHGIRCKALVDEAVDIALPMFHAFAREYEMKSDSRNSLNDIFILSVSSYWKAPLLTRDRLLARFSQDYLEAKLEDVEECQKIELPRTPSKVRKMRESKGYVNKNWRTFSRSAR